MFTAKTAKPPSLHCCHSLSWTEELKKGNSHFVFQLQSLCIYSSLNAYEHADIGCQLPASSSGFYPV